MKQESKSIPQGTPVLFKNLLEENEEDICRGEMLPDGLVKCLCGCNGCFEQDDIEILEIGPSPDH